MGFRFVSCVVAAASVVASVAAAGDREDFERQVIAELGERDATAVPLLERAEAARLGGDSATARALYAELLERVPGFDHAQRRLCSLESRAGNHDRALELCRAAVEKRESAENVAGLSFALTYAGRLPAAETAAKRAVALAPESSTAQAAMCEVALSRDNVPLLERCSAKLLALRPDEVSTHFYATIAAGSTEDWDAARRHLERAHELGLPDPVYEELSAKITELEPLWPVVLKLAGLAIGVWLGVMLLLLIAGGVLSRMTMRAADRLTSQRAREPEAAAGSALRRAYRAVLALSCVVYYASLPLLLAIIVLTGGGLIYAFWAAGYIPIKLVLIIALVTAVSAFAVLRSLFVRARDDDPGTRLDLDEHPRLRALLDEVAAKIETRPVDNVYLTPGSDIAVTERGGVFQQMRGDSERCLILGAGVLEGMPLPAFKAILAHEYGHFSNRDTAGGGFALAVRRSLVTIGVSLAQSGSAGWYNPAWLFFRVFYRMFQGISQGASRLQEIMADRWAVLSYGAANFETGLRHAIRASLAFDQHLDRTLEEVVEEAVPLHNLYTYQPAAALDDGELDEAVAEVIDARPGPYDSHPRPADRFRWAHAMGAPEPEGDGGEGDAWSLLDDRQGLELQMTDEIRHRIIDRFGIDIANPDDEEE